MLIAACVLCCAGTSRSHAQSAAPLLLPSALAYDAAGNLYIADARRHQVLEATLAGTLVVVAGDGTQGFAGDGGPAAAAELNSPQGLAFGSDGTLYVADTGNARIRAVLGGVITTFAGTGAPQYGGDGGAPAQASFRSPTALAMTASGALLVCDTEDQRVRQIAAGVVTTAAGNGVQGFSGDGGLATSAELDSPSGVAVAADGRIFVADTHNQRVRAIAAGSISTFAGTGQRGYAGDGGPAANALLSGPRGLAVTPAGALVIAEAGNQRVRSVATSGIIGTIAGNGLQGSSTDGAIAGKAALNAPRALAVSPFGTIAVADTLNAAVRVLLPAGSLFVPAAFAPGRRSTLRTDWSTAQTYGQATATAAVTGPVGTPQGAVALSEGGATLGTANLLAGSASLQLPTLSAGTHAVAATYRGDGLNPAAVEGDSSLVVSPAPVVAAADPATVAYGMPVGALTGSVTGVLPQDQGQVEAAFWMGQPGPPAVGTWPIQATLSGPASANYTVTLAPTSGSLQVLPAATTTSLGSVGQIYTGGSIQLTATVSPAGSGVPSGTVEFLGGGALIATANLANGSASASYTPGAAGTVSITAQYSGDQNFRPSSSGVQTAQVTALPDFGLSPTGASTATVAAGELAGYSIQVSANPGPFTGIVVLSAKGLPGGTTAVFSPVQVVPGAGSATVNVSIQTPMPQVGMRLAPRPSRGLLWAGGAFFFAGLALRRRRAFWLAGFALLLGGCGARTVSEGLSAPAAQTYAVQILGTATNAAGAVVVHSTQVTLIVQ